MSNWKLDPEARELVEKVSERVPVSASSLLEDMKRASSTTEVKQMPATKYGQQKVKEAEEEVGR